jgi:hypothetical protein
MHRGRCCLIGLLALAACGSSSRPASVPMGQAAPVRTTLTHGPGVSSVAPNPVVTRACKAELAITVRAENHTTARGDLCAAYHRAENVLMGNPGGLAPGEFVLTVTLDALATEPVVTCAVSLQLTSKSLVIASVSGSAYTSHKEDYASRDCIDGVIGDMLEKQIGPAMRQHLAAQTAAPAASSGSAAAPSGPPPSP